ncbi:MAG TPA: hypothetical protein VE344_05075 [Methylomirabilota bacterium]|nr:hypothetical protein [Methylomirabilota bacterium]
MSRRRKILIAAGIVLGMAILVPVIRHYQLRFAVANYVAELKAKGEPMELAQVISPPTSPEQNGVPFIRNALANLKPEGIHANNPPPAMQMVASGKAMIGWQQPDIRSSDGINQWEDLGRELAAAKSDLDSFQNLTNHPILDFNLDYQKGADIQLPNLASLKRSAQWLSASALYDLHQGNPKNACADVRAMLALVKGETDERTLISQLVRIAIFSMVTSPTWEVLQNPNVSDDDLAQLQQDWQSLEFTTPLEQAMMFERVEQLQQFGQIRKSSEKFDKLWGDFYTTHTSRSEGSFLKKRSLFLRKWDELRWRWFWSYQDEVRGLQAFQVMIDATRMAETNESFQLAESFALARLKPDQNSSYDLRNYFSQFGSASQAALRKSMKIETARNVVVTAIALKRYELRHHQLPGTLDELTPDLLKAVPIDCMDGEPLRYRPRADETFLLYSVGENGVDDDGDPSLQKNIKSSNFYWQNDHALDWVWPQPATEGEVQKYYEKQAKSRN